MIAVCDTTPLNYLILAGYVEVLPALFDEILIPRAVAREPRHLEAPDSVQPTHFEAAEVGSDSQGIQS